MAFVRFEGAKTSALPGIIPPMAAKGNMTGLLLILLSLSIAPGCRRQPSPPPPPDSNSTRKTPVVVLDPPSPTVSDTQEGGPQSETVSLDSNRWRAFRRAVRSAATQAIAEHDRDPNTHIGAGIRAMDSGNHTAAADCFRRALKLNPNHQGALLGLTEALVADKKHQEAVPIYERILFLSPGDERARFNLAVVESRLRNFDRAAQHYRRLLKQNEGHVQGRYNLATLCQAQGKLAAAREQWEQVVARAPHLPSAHTALGEVLTDLGESQAAMNAYAQAAKLRPEDVSSWINFVAGARAAGSYGRAMAGMRNALKLAPLDADLWARQGEIQLEVHRTTGKIEFLHAAISSWQKSMELDPHREDVRRRLRHYGGG